jgi:hypothetical protein
MNQEYGHAGRNDVRGRHDDIVDGNALDRGKVALVTGGSSSLGRRRRACSPIAAPT